MFMLDPIQIFSCCLTGDIRLYMNALSSTPPRAIFIDEIVTLFFILLIGIGAYMQYTNSFDYYLQANSKRRSFCALNVVVSTFEAFLRLMKSEKNI